MFDAGSNRGLVSVRCWCPGVLRVNLCLLGIEDSVFVDSWLPCSLSQSVCWSVCSNRTYYTSYYFFPVLLRVNLCLLGIEDSALFISLLTCLSAP